MTLPKFDGATFTPVLDEARLSSSLQRVVKVMRDGQYRTLREIANMAQCSEAGASARLRDLRKDRFRAEYRVLEVNSMRLAATGTWKYKVVFQ